MSRKHRTLVVVILAAVLLVAASALAWGSMAAPSAPAGAADGEERGNSAADALPAAAVPGGPGFYSLSAHLFMAPDQNTPYGYYLGSLLYNSGASEGVFRGSVFLPHGATVNQFVLYYLDNSAENIRAELYRCSQYNVCSVMAMVDSTGASASYRYGVDDTIDLGVIDNQSYVYYVRVVLPGGQGSTLCLLGVRVDYEYSAGLPLVMKNH